MFGETFSHNLLTKYTAVFGTLFNDLSIQRSNSAGNRIQTLAVPLEYAPKERWLVRSQTDPDLDREIAVQYPRMSFERVGILYSPDRVTQPKRKRVYPSSSDENKVLTQYVPVPYDIQFNLYIGTSNMKDMDDIVEQIVPFFTPEFTVNMKLIPEMDDVRDVPIVLEAVTTEDNYEGAFPDRRILITTLSFTMRGWMYGPISNSAVIKEIDINFYTPEDINRLDNVPRVVNIDIKPGMYANGAPTSNSSVSVSHLTINANDDYGFITTKTIYNDGIG